MGTLGPLGLEWGPMDRKTPGGHYTPAFRKHVLDWVRSEPDRTGASAGRQFDVDEGTVRKWMRKSGIKAETSGGTFSPESPGSGSAPAGGRPPSRAKSRGPAGGRYRAPVEELGVEDRERALRTVRNIAQVVDIGTTHLLERMERARRVWEQAELVNSEDAKLMASLMSMSKDDTQSMLNLSRTQGLIIDTHPGLMKLAGVKEKSESGTRKLAEVAAALGVVVKE